MSVLRTGVHLGRETTGIRDGGRYSTQAKCCEARVSEDPRGSRASSDWLYYLRHTAATLAIAAGISVKVISEQLGHSSILSTLERYSHVLSMQDDAAAKVEKMLAA